MRSSALPVFPPGFFTFTTAAMAMCVSANRSQPAGTGKTRVLLRVLVMGGMDACQSCWMHCATRHGAVQPPAGGGSLLLVTALLFLRLGMAVAVLPVASASGFHVLGQDLLFIEIVFDRFPKMTILN